MKRILICGEDSYIGTSFEAYVKQNRTDWTAETVSLRGDAWKETDFRGFDTVLQVAGIAHQKETEENAHLYYEVNRNLAVAVAEQAKAQGVKQFVFLSSESVYGMETGKIDRQTAPNPISHYGKSKWQAEQQLQELVSESFSVAVVRPPMVYGKGCKGNYQRLRALALKSPVFPSLHNQRSMIYIENLCDFLTELMEKGVGGLFLPQNEEYAETARLVSLIAAEHGKKMRLWPIFNPFVKALPIGAAKKAFGSLFYTEYDPAGKVGFAESIRRTERE